MDSNILIERLTGKGILDSNVPAYLRDVTNNLDTKEDIDLQDLNQRLRRLGWDEFELDDHTLQLIIANLESQEQEAKDAPKIFLYENNPDVNEIAGNQSH